MTSIKEATQATPITDGIDTQVDNNEAGRNVNFTAIIGQGQMAEAVKNPELRQILVDVYRNSSDNVGRHPQTETAHGFAVRAFALLAGQNIPTKPTEPSLSEKILRARLILEEAIETIQEGLGLDIVVDGNLLPLKPFKQEVCPIELPISERPFDLRAVVDGVLDVNVVSTGTLYACGVHHTGEMELEVNANNIMKFDATGDGHRNEHGKWIKPSNHPEPKLDILLEMHKAGVPVKEMEILAAEQ